MSFRSYTRSIRNTILYVWVQTMADMYLKFTGWRQDKADPRSPTDNIMRYTNYTCEMKKLNLAKTVIIIFWFFLFAFRHFFPADHRGFILTSRSTAINRKNATGSKAFRMNNTRPSVILLRRFFNAPGRCFWRQTRVEP